LHTTPFELGPIRPVAESNSLLIRTTRGCPWGKCEFCTSYCNTPFSLRTVEEIKNDIGAAKEFYKGNRFTSCFLQDGDSLIMKTQDLLDVLKFLKESFPNLNRITSYGRAATIAKKSLSEMQEICNAGINRLYCGMESGSDNILKNINKGATSKDIIKAGTMAKKVGMEISEFLILGLGGKALWQENAIESAKVLNEINPQYIRVRAIRVKPNSGLEKQYQSGSFILPSEEDIIAEQRLLLENLDGISSYFSNDHISNLLLEVEGRIPQDKQKLINILDNYLDLSEQEKIHFNIGMRIGYYRTLGDMNDLNLRELVDNYVQEFQSKYPGQESEIYNYLRVRNS
jgi:radical SAM superfamily enzyme YgiQ (UPF0313 family)